MKTNIVAIAFFLCFCSTTYSQSQIKEFLDLSYLPKEEVVVDSLQRLNLLIPEDIKKPPLLLWIGGGAWSFVNRNIEMDLCRKLAEEGIAVASVGHRLSKGTYSEKRHQKGIKHPEHIKDIAAAFKWLYDNAEAYGYDRQQIFVGGFSSGAHLSALLAMDPQYLAKHQLSFSTIRGVLPISGAFDIDHYYLVFKNHENPETREFANTHVKDVFGEVSEFKAASPVAYISHLRSPLLLVTDSNTAKYTRLFEKRLKEEKYTDFEVYYKEDFNHGDLWRDLSGPDNSGTRKLMSDFIKSRSL